MAAYVCLKSVLVDGTTLEAVAVSVDRVDGEAKELGHLLGVLDTKPGEGQQAQLGGHAILIIGRREAFVGLQQAVDDGNEVGIAAQEGIVKNRVEGLKLRAHHFSGLKLLQ